jgi:hypothetical protein
MEIIMHDVKWTGWSWGIYDSDNDLVKAGFRSVDEAVAYCYGEGWW